MSIIAATSIAPKHINEGIQLKAINSWLEAGYNVYSFNHPSEIPLLKDIYKGVIFIPTYKTQEKIFGKHYVSINGIFDYCIENGHDLILFNSDIELRTDKETLTRIEAKMDNAIVMANRVNYENETQNSTVQYILGIDAFFIKHKYLQLYPQTAFCLGQCHFDYYIPYLAAINGIETIFVKQNVIYHKNHNAQYNHDNWVRTGNHFMWLTNMYQFTNRTDRMSTHVFNYIYNISKKENI